ncbi:MAG: hypothetical protein ABIV25_10960 [Paracoccaceae bacterium]
MTPAEQSIGVLFLLAVMALPRLAQSGRALAVTLAVGTAVLAALWFGWVEQLPQGLGNVAQAGAVVLTAAAFALGVTVRALVLIGRKRGWPKATDAVLSISAVAVAGLSLLAIFDML